MRVRRLRAGSAVAVWWTVALGAVTGGCRRGPSVEGSVAQVERVRSGVLVQSEGRSERDVRTVQRLAEGDVVRVDANGRAFLSLDGGGRYVLDHGAAVRVRGPRSATLEQGRLWVAGGGEGGRSEETLLTVGDAVLHLRGARASVTQRPGQAQVSVLSGEIAYEVGTHRGAIRTGETGDLSRTAARVAAHAAYDDWTGGLADDVPGAGAEVAGLGSVGARTPGETGQPRWPMVMQKLEANVVVRGDLAITTVDQWFFNPSGTTVEGLYTFNTPPGAVLQMFGVDRRGQIVEGVVRERQQAAARYREQVYQGSTHDPALLEWDAPGRYHAKLYPIAAGATRRVRVRYAQWLAPEAGGRRTYRLPLAALDTRVGELRADFDLADANVSSVRAGHAARVVDGHLIVSESDVLPRADLVVELDGLPGQAVSAQRVPVPGDPRGGFLRVAVRPPVESTREARDEGVDLVIVVDHSAATDELALRLEQAFVESLLGALDPRDAVLVLAGDVRTRVIGGGQAQLAAATAERRRAITEALGRDRLGGATDLGAMIAEAHRALRPGRNGAIVYVGDGQATVGESELPSLRATMARLSPRPRFYAVAVGEEPRLELLDGIASPAGMSRRITRRGDVARTALELLEHASRPLVRNVRAELGPNVTAVYPAEPVDLPVGEPLVLVGRYPGDAPREITVRGLWNGREFTETMPLSAAQMDDGGDLRFRWANGRLENLLARGEQRAVIVELGTRFGLITPFTSLYVASEDEVSALDRARREGPALVTRWSELSPADFLPIVGCSKARSVMGRAQSEEPAVQSSAPAAMTASSDERGRGERQGASARYAIRNNGGEEQLARQAAAAPSAQSAAEAEVAPVAPAAPPMPSRARGATASAPIEASDILGEDFQNLAERRGTGEGGGGDGEGTLGLGGLGVMGHGSGTGSGNGYGSGAGGGLRARQARGPLVRIAPVTVTGALSTDAVRRVILRNLGQIAFCHEQSLAEDPSVSGRVVVRFFLDGSGIVQRADAVDVSYPIPSFAECATRAVRRWQFPSSENGGSVVVSAPFVMTRGEGTGPATVRRAPGEPPSGSEDGLARCSDAASVPLAQRVGLWGERITVSDSAWLARVYRQARAACEASSWAERVSMLRLLASRAGNLDGRLSLYNAFAFDPSARSWLRTLILRELARSGQLARAQELGLGRLDASTMAQALGVASTPAQRLNVLQELARRYPDDMDLATRALDEAVAQGARELVRALTARMRAHPQADGRVRTAAGEALLAIGDEPEARRCFSEIVEFAPDDPDARRRLGDIALSHGWAEEAYRQFQMLAASSNEAPEVLLRQAMAARMAGRLDEAVRLAERVAQESSSGNGTLGDVASAWIGLELALAASDPRATRPTVDALRARWRLSSAARGAGALRVIVRWTHPDDAAELYLAIAGETPRRSDWVAGQFFFESTVFADAPGPLALEVRRSEGARPRGSVELVLVFNEGRPDERVERRALAMGPDRARYVFDLAGAALTERPAGAALVSEPGVAAGVAAERATGGAR